MGGTPWHAHHIAERYGLLAIIALGEGVVGTVASLSAVGRRAGLDVRRDLRRGRGHRAHVRHVVDVFRDAGGRPAARPSRAVVLVRLLPHRDRSAAIVATGAGLHAAAYYIEHHSKLGSVGHGVGRGATGRGLHRLGLRPLRMLLVRTVDAFHLLLLVLTAVVLVIAVWLAAAGISMANCLLVVTLAPMVTVVGLRNARPSARRGRPRQEPARRWAA